MLFIPIRSDSLQVTVLERIIVSAARKERHRPRVRRQRRVAKTRISARLKLRMTAPCISPEELLRTCTCLDGRPARQLLLQQAVSDTLLCFQLGFACSDALGGWHCHQLPYQFT